MGRSFVLGLANAAAMIAAAQGCTLLIPFESVADAGARADAAQAVGCADDVPLDAIECVNTERPNCAKTTAAITKYPDGRDRTNDLVTCVAGGKATCVKHCPRGCVVMPTGHDDVCDPCFGKDNASYCGRDVDLGAGSDDVSITCRDGQAVETKACTQCPAKCP
jgi:hypothetical protein